MLRAGQVSFSVFSDFGLCVIACVRPSGAAPSPLDSSASSSFLASGSQKNAHRHTMKAVHVSLGARELVDRPVPEPAAGEVLIKSALILALPGLPLRVHRSPPLTDSVFPGPGLLLSLPLRARQMSPCRPTRRTGRCPSLSRATRASRVTTWRERSRPSARASPSSRRATAYAPSPGWWRETSTERTASTP